MMSSVQKRWQIFWVALVLALLGVAVVRAAIVDLDAWVEYSIMQGDGTTPLADGSWVYIIGSGNAISDPMQSIGTNFIAGSVTGDDVILGVVQINLDAYSNGTFFTTLQYESDEVNYVYIRFFEFTNAPITGLVAWGTSAIFGLGITLGVSTVEFGQNYITQTNNFVVIPEPTTGNLIVLVAGMMWAMRSSMRRAEKTDRKEGERV
jgi:hypothetical protein